MSSNTEAIRLFDELKGKFRSVRTKNELQHLVDRTKSAIKLTFGNDSPYLSQIDSIDFSHLQERVSVSSTDYDGKQTPISVGGWDREKVLSLLDIMTDDLSLCNSGPLTKQGYPIPGGKTLADVPPDDMMVVEKKIAGTDSNIAQSQQSERRIQIPKPIVEGANAATTRITTTIVLAFAVLALIGTLCILSFLVPLEVREGIVGLFPENIRTSVGQIFPSILPSATPSVTLLSATNTFTPLPASSLTLTKDPNTSICGGKQRVVSGAGQFRGDLGVTIFDSPQNSLGMLDAPIRAVAIDAQHGVWFGYFPSNNTTNSVNGIGQFDRKTWEQCSSGNFVIGQNTNAIAFDNKGNVWVATDGYGVQMFDGTNWRVYTTNDGLPNNSTYQIITDSNGLIWVATLDGVAKFDGLKWTTPYTTANAGTLVNNRVSTMLFLPNGEKWFGYIGAGFSRLTASGWQYYSTQSQPKVLGSDNVRRIISDPNDNIWIATDGGGITRLDAKTDQPTIYNSHNSTLIDDSVTDLAVDKYDRIWAGTPKGASYFDGKTWQTYAAGFNVLSIAFGPSCGAACPASFDDNHVWLGTKSGLTHSQLPPTGDVVRIVSVEYPKQVQPGEKFSPKIVVQVLPGFTLKGGDMLHFSGTNDADRFGAFELVAVKGTIDPGDTYEFVNDNKFTAPEILGTYTSTWRVWQSGRYVSQEISITFRVQSNGLSF